MPAFTSFLNLYKPGGGSTGTITPDEVFDVDRFNANADLIDDFAESWGDADLRNHQFTGPASNIGSVSGMKLGDTYQETDGSKILWEYSGTAWRPRWAGMCYGTAAERAAASSQYFQFWKDTDADEYIWVGDDSGGWRRYSGHHAQGSAAWDTVQSSGGVSLAGRTFNATIPTVVSAEETVIISAQSTGSGFGFLSVASVTRNPSDTVLGVRFGQVGSATTQGCQFAWQVVRNSP